ncbi:MAG: transporter substrate-binding domain-containing protein [Rhodospirillales bacterium]|nr:transporter substrate-binding domain-containing protein [Rhodospirillales bacterium]
MTEGALSELTDPGRLRVGINLGNILLVTGTSATGDPQGVAPDMAAMIAERLGVGVSYVTFATPGEVADAVERNEWDIGLIAVEPKRAEKIAFCDAYVEIETTYLVPANSPIQSIADVDQPGVRIAVSDRAAYDLYLSRTLKHAELHRAKGLAGALELFVTEKLDALAGLLPALKENAENLPGSRVLDGGFSSVRQAIGTKPENVALKAFVEQFIAEAKDSGLVADLIERHGVKGKLRVATGS